MFATTGNMNRGSENSISAPFPYATVELFKSVPRMGEYVFPGGKTGKSLSEIAAHLDAALENGDEGVLFLALRQVASKTGGMSHTGEKCWAESREIVPCFTCGRKSQAGDINSRKKLYPTLKELQNALADWIEYYNNDRTHQSKICCWRTPRVLCLMANRFGSKRI